MRKLLLIIVAAACAIQISGQTGHFKMPAKKPAGSVQHHLNPVIISPQNTLKVASVKAPVMKSLSFSDAKTERIVVRKGDIPVYIETKTSPTRETSSVTFEDRLFSFLESNKSVTGIDNPRDVIHINDIHTDDLGITHIRTVQRYKGIEVYGTESVYHWGMGKERFNGSFFKTALDIDDTPVIQHSHALSIVKADLEQITVYRELSDREKKMLDYHVPECSPVIFNRNDGTPVLAWMIMVRPNLIEEWQYVIDATNGSIIRKFNNTKSDGPVTGTGTDLNNISRTIDVYLDAGTYYMINTSEPMYNAATDEGIIMTLDANNTSTSDLDYSLISSTNNQWTGYNAAISAHYNAAISYEYFRSTFGRNSLNGQGGNIVSFVNVAEPDGSSMQNAFWNGKAVFYGNGGTHFKSLSGALDVAAHELGHGVVSNSANLEYIGQSGAMNETYADIFGSMVDRDDWLIGEDVVKTTHYPSGALRNMSDPHNGGTAVNSYWQPSHLSEMYLGSQDNGGVHINSGIGNRAYYLYATAVTKEKAERVFYRALTQYLTKTSQFIDFRIAVVQAAKDLYGNTSTEAVKAGEAFDAVGIYTDEPQTEDPGEYDPNPGTEHLLFFNTIETDPYTIYTTPTSPLDLSFLTSTLMKGKLSVTDDGSGAVFVDLNDRINVMELDPENPFNDHPISDEAFFDNVAVSKDGNRLAAVSIEADASIYVYDFISEEWAQFPLYNPTTGDVTAGGVLYADAIEFDHSGEYLIYDAYNELNSNTSNDLSYWDVGFIKVWDNASNSFGDGSILKLFTQLPENVSVGNPVFSKNSPNIIAFDYFYYDGINEEYGIYGANLETGDLSYIFENTTLGYPSFSKNDDRLAFTVAVSEEEEDIAAVDLLDDKITPAGMALVIMDYARWPVYYATGQRELGLAPVANFTADYKTGDAPLQVQFLDLSSNHPDVWQWTFQGGNPSTSGLQNPEVTYSNPGTYKVTLRVENNTGENTITRNGYIVITGQTPAEGTSEPALMFYPNPVDEVLNVQYTGDFTIRIFSQSGSLLVSDSNRKQIDLKALSPGVYILEIKTSSGVYINKLVKQ